jgi:hypothetical protein
LLWFGCYTMIAGMFVSFRRRALIARKPVRVRANPRAVKVDDTAQPDPVPSSV